MRKLLAVLVLMSLMSPLLMAQNKNNSVILVYPAKIYNYSHDQVQGTDYLQYLVKDWFAYHLIELKPDTREYLKEAIITYYEGEQFQDYGCGYKEYIDSKKDTKSHITGSVMVVPKNSSNKSWGSDNKGFGRLAIGAFSNKRGRNVGWSQKVVVPTKIRGRFITFNDKKGKSAGEVWSNKLFFLKINGKETKHVNQNNMSLEEAFDYISEKLEVQGFGKAIKYDSDK
jgi:hypothetical protein